MPSRRSAPRRVPLHVVNEQIVNILIQERFRQGLRQSDMAEALGKTTQSWSNIELHRAKLTVDAFFQVCQRLQVKPDMIYQWAMREQLRIQRAPVPRAVPRVSPRELASAAAAR